MKFCQYCGNQLNDDAVFCDKCGKKVGGASQPAKDDQPTKDGKVYKCPYCGGNLPSDVSVCPSCGSEIRGREAVSSIKDFHKSLQQIEDDDDDNKKVTLIRTFPIPNNKEDIVEFMLLASSNFDAEHYLDDKGNAIVDAAWLAKIEQCYKKSKIMFSSQRDLQQIENIYKEVQAKLHKKKKKSLIIILAALAALIVPIIVISIVFSVDSAYVPDPEEGQTIFLEYGYDHFKEENYVNVQAYFVSKGFEDVTLNPLGDLITGWVTKEGTVESVSINGDSSFHKNRWYYPTDKVIINYHSF